MRSDDAEGMQLHAVYADEPHTRTRLQLLSSNTRIRNSSSSSYIWHDLVPVLGLYSQNKLIFHCIHDFDKYQVILNLSLYLDIFPLFSLKSITDMVLEYSDKVKKSLDIKSFTV